jgi:hypothetical protein
MALGVTCCLFRVTLLICERTEQLRTSRTPCAIRPLRYRVALDFVVHGWLVFNSIVSLCVWFARGLSASRTSSAFEILWDRSQHRSS